MNQDLRIKTIWEMVPHTKKPISHPQGRNKKLTYVCVNCGRHRRWTIAEVDRILEGSVIIHPCRCGCRDYKLYDPRENQTKLEV